jgi:hypothetical protein
MIRGGRNMEVIFLFYIFYFCPTLLKLAGTTNASNNKIKKKKEKRKPAMYFNLKRLVCQK